MRRPPTTVLPAPRVPLTADQIDEAERLLGLVPWQTDFLRRLNGVAQPPNCHHAYVTSDGNCLHCNTDCSAQMAAAVQRLNACIAGATR